MKSSFLVLLPVLSMAAEESRTCSLINYETSLSYLFWNAREDSLSFALKDQLIFTPQTPSVEPIVGHIKSPKGRWDSGFRVETAFSDHTKEFGHFGLRAQWSYFHSTSSAHTATPAGSSFGVIVSSVSILGAGASPFPTAESARSKWTLHLNEFALNLEYFCHAAPRVLLRPYVGVFGASIEQSLHSRYQNVSFDLASIFTSHLNVRTKNDFWGVGPSVGAGLSWSFWEHLALIGNLFASGLYGRFHTKNSVSVSDPVQVPFTDFKSNPTRLRPVIGGLLGLECGGNVSPCARLSLSAAYEFQYWWQQWHSFSNQIGNFVSGTGQWGDLSLQGFVFTAKAEF